MKIVAVLSHPDDEAFGMSGTIKKLTDMGSEVILVETTDGNAASTHFSSNEKLIEKGSVKEMRREELWESAKILGVNNIYFFDYPDGSLSNSFVYNNELLKKIKKVLKKEKPDIVLSHDQTGISWHIDHIVTSMVTSRAVMELGKLVDKMFVLNPVPNFQQRLEFIDNLVFKPNYYVDIKDVFEYKKKSIMAHQSQKYDWLRYFRNKENLNYDKEFYLLKFDNGRNEEIFEVMKKLETRN